MTEVRFGPTGWNLARVPSLVGKTYVITGANSGVGFEATRLLCERGAQVVMLCRNLNKAEASIQSLLAAQNDAKLKLFQLDLNSLQQVREVSLKIKADYPKIDGLICNAGLMMLPSRVETEDGFERQLGVNHLAHFALCCELFQQVELACGRFVMVSSIAHRLPPRRILFEDLQSKASYNSLVAYNQSKLANLLFCFELQRRLTVAKCQSIALACHPGYSNTNLQTTGPSWLLGRIMWVGNQIFAQRPEYGAWPEVLAATEAHVNGGEYFGPCQFGETRGRIDLNTPAPHALDPDAAQKLWQVSTELTGAEWSI